jgi:hypothetical protein
LSTHRKRIKRTKTTTGTEVGEEARRTKTAIQTFGFIVLSGILAPLTLSKMRTMMGMTTTMMMVVPMINQGEETKDHDNIEDIYLGVIFGILSRKTVPEGNGILWIRSKLVR